MRVKKKKKNRAGVCMTILSKKGLLVFSIAILSVQVLLAPLNILNAETMEDREVTQKQKELQGTEDSVTESNQVYTEKPSIFDTLLESDNTFDENEDYNNLDSSGLTSRNLNTFPYFVQLGRDDGRPLTNTHLIPDNLIFANARPSNSNTWLNGRLITGDTDIFAGDKIIFENVAGNINPGLNAEYTVVSVPDGGQVTRDGFRGRWGSGSGTVRELVMDVRYINSEGEILTGPVWTSYRDPSLGSNAASRVHARQDSLLFAAAVQTTLPWDTIAGNYRFTFTHTSINLVTTGDTRRFQITMAQSNIYTFHRQQGEALDIDYSRLSVSGQTNESTFSSKYHITQDIPGFTKNNLEILVSHPSILREEEVEIFSITDNQGNDLTNMVNITKNEAQTIFTINEAELETLRTNSVNIVLEYKLEKSEALYEYLAGDYVAIPIEASNSRSSTVASDNAQTWVRPWGEAIPQEVGQDTSTSDFNPADFVGNLENKLVGDKPFAIGFSEEKSFDSLGETSIGVIIESTISGIQNTIDVPVTVIENRASVFVHHLDKEGTKLADTEELVGRIGEAFETEEKEIENYRLTEIPANASGFFTKEEINVTYVYEIAPVESVDPLKPEVEVDPENKPELPEYQGLLSIDFASSFNFGEQTISVQDKIYYAQPQRLLDTDGTVNEAEKRPNYVQVSDRRSENERSGWQLAVTQKEQFHTQDGSELDGARLRFTNQQLATAQGGEEPELLHEDLVTLVPRMKQPLLRATSDNGTGTWIYRFGDRDTADESVALEVPSTTSPEAKAYSTTLTWELSSVPGND